MSVTVGVVDTRLAAATLSGTGARVYTAHRGWLGVVTGISATSTGGVLVFLITNQFSHPGKAVCLVCACVYVLTLAFDVNDL